jgi:peroxiredoxin
MNKSLVVKILVALVLTAGLVMLSGVWTKPDVAPEVTYKNIDGTQLTTSGLKGKMVLVNFWATSCVTCVAEMPKIVETFKKFENRGYKTVAVAMSYDRADYVLNFVKTRGIPFNVALDLDGQIAKKFGDIKITPTNILIDEQGNIIKRWVGAPDFEDLAQLLDKRLPKAM